MQQFRFCSNFDRFGSDFQRYCKDTIVLSTVNAEDTRLLLRGRALPQTVGGNDSATPRTASNVPSPLPSKTTQRSSKLAEESAPFEREASRNRNIWRESPQLVKV